jgi:hypothetical protein
MSHYESEFTQFMRVMMVKHPEWAEEQRIGRSLLWDKKVDFTELQRFSEASVTPDVYNFDFSQRSLQGG